MGQDNWDKVSGIVMFAFGFKKLTEGMTGTLPVTSSNFIDYYDPQPLNRSDKAQATLAVRSAATLTQGLDLRSERLESQSLSIIKGGIYVTD